MPVSERKIPSMDDATIEERRLDLLYILAVDVNPVAIFYDLEQSEFAVFMITDTAANAIRRGLANRYRRQNESSALARIKVAARTTDGSGIVYRLESFQFEQLGTGDAVLSERERLKPGEIEVHTHVYSSPDYLDHTDAGDLIAAVEGPAWVDPQTARVNAAIRIFGILSVHANHLARLQFYVHDLRDHLGAWNNYGLKRLGNPITLLDAY